MAEIRCRAGVHEDCYDGRPEEEIYHGGDTQRSDGTYTSFGVIEPFASDLDRPTMQRAIEHYEVNYKYVFERDDEELPPLLVEADENRARATPGTPSWTSADACYRMVQREVERRSKCASEQS